ncbi:ArgR family transcriptional regulator [Enterococcus durans]|uniref:Arginine repressor n=1 Tax=Enterococcus durans TaxID=53345 RepID=A0A5N0YNH2_9ENTE|nr:MULTISPECIES: ArgR family transcriptional regulator [Enterococcus]KAA9177620.1 ArgR family transcriptional regulator [Enterococcus durans]KAA9183251.1 ArgR family transcriptional regulator [Enterococcus durans]KAA9184486.1 ArgR family transcriptional regulator [Enterococcus durans]KAA9189350.1 ArgR family transcriptional regulator [Enterococcus durans]KAA9191508.1 ArgR family transcriptional regulator [Enterococcus durans]
MRKAERHLLIKQVIDEFTIRTQEELLTKLSDYGVNATQATISRDIRDLKIVKAPDENGISRFVFFQGKEGLEAKNEDEKRLIQMIEDIVLKVERVHFLTIVHTLPDNAPLFAAVLDEIKPPHIVSTIAGFDTTIIISQNEADAQLVEDFLHHPKDASIF